MARAGQAGGAPQPVRGLKIHQVGSTVTLAVTGSPCFLGGASLPKYALTDPLQFSGLTFSIIDVPLTELLSLNGSWSNVYCLPMDCIDGIKLHMACHADIHPTETFTQEICGRHGVRVLSFGDLVASDTKDYLPVGGSRTDYYIAPMYEFSTRVAVVDAQTGGILNTKAPSYAVLHDGANSAKMEDNVEGVGGIIEVTKEKYGCLVGQRLRVLGRTGGPTHPMWKCTGGKTVSMAQRDNGWRWITKGPVRPSVEDWAVSRLRTDPTMQPPSAATPWKPTIPCLAVDGSVDDADYSWMQ